MNRKVVYIFISALVLLFVLISCKKKKQDNILVGQWEVVPISYSDSLRGPPIWTFHDNNMLTRYSVHPSYGYEINDTGYYFFEQEFSKFFISVHGLDEYTDGNYDVVDLNKVFMIVEQTNPYVHKEFKRL